MPRITHTAEHADGRTALVIRYSGADRADCWVDVECLRPLPGPIPGHEEHDTSRTVRTFKGELEAEYRAVEWLEADGFTVTESD